MRSIFLFIILAGQCLRTSAQAISLPPATGNFQPASWVRFIYENDFFRAADRYYTQGIALDMAGSQFTIPATRHLLLLPRGTRTYGVGLEHNGYTPTSISSDSILHGDCPFAAALFARCFGTSYDSLHHRLFTAALSAGVVGSAAGGAEMQTYIHEHTGNRIPHGWQYQVQNDLVLNYHLSVEQRVLATQNFLYLSARALADMGTLNTRLGVGANITAGLLPGKKRFALFAAYYPSLYAVGYNATLQGGLFNHSSPYTIPAADISRVTYQHKLQLAVQLQKLRLAYTTSYMTKEFKTAYSHAWGGIEAVLVKSL